MHDRRAAHDSDLPPDNNRPVYLHFPIRRLVGVKGDCRFTPMYSISMLDDGDAAFQSSRGIGPG